MSQTRTPWREYNGIEVTIDQNGNFHASVNGVWVNDPSWERLRLKIEEEKKAETKAIKIALDCVVLIGNEDTDFSVQRAMLVGLSRTNSMFRFKESGIDSKYVQCVLPYSPKNLSLLEELATAKSTARDIQEAIKPRLLHQDRWGNRIEPTKYSEKLENLKERYSVALKGEA